MNLDYKSPVLCVVGPTAVGKTAIAIELAGRLNGEIIGLDSRQIYKGLEIGTAQPTAKEQDKIRHHLVGTRDIKNPISAGEYAHLVWKAVGEILERDNQPIICGGAGLYFRAVREGIFRGSVSALGIRKRLNREYEDIGGEQLLNRLRDIDPDYAKIVHPNNQKRLVRALEIYEATGQPPTEHFSTQKQNEPGSEGRFFTVYLSMDMEILLKNIEDRTEAMLKAGIIDETKRLSLKFDPESIHAIDSIGYRQVTDYLDGKISKSEMISEINVKTRQYAKRQIAWFKNEHLDLIIHMVEKQSAKKSARIIEKEFLTYLKSV
jgi:tRNA dimethylallyltransferase